MGNIASLRYAQTTEPLRASDGANGQGAETVGTARQSAVNLEEARRVMGIFGTGRSGTTWLGAILSSHPDVIYRFEPLRVGANAGAKLSRFCHALGMGKVKGEASGELYELLRPAHCEMEKPPFFPK